MSRSREEGFTLMEALVALAVAAIAAAGLMSALSSSGTRSAQAETRSHALSKARTLLVDALATPNILQHPRRGQTDDARLTWTIAFGEENQPYPGLQQVDIAVTWKAAGKQGVTRLAAYRLTGQ